MEIASSEGYLVDIAVEAFARSGLLLDITALLADEKIHVSGMNTVTDEHVGTARMTLTA